MSQICITSPDGREVALTTWEEIILTDESRQKGGGAEQGFHEIRNSEATVSNTDMDALQRIVAAIVENNDD